MQRHNTLTTSDIFEYFFNHPRSNNVWEWSEVKSNAAAYELIEEEAAWVITVPVPGLSKDDVKVTVEAGPTLVIETKKQACGRKSPNNMKFKLNDDASIIDDISASVKHGVTSIRIPKRQQRRPSQPREIMIS